MNNGVAEGKQPSATPSSKVSVISDIIPLGYDAPEVIEDRPEDARGASCLILAWMADGEPIHVVVAYWAAIPRVVTAYRPSQEYFDADFKTRV